MSLPPERANVTTAWAPAKVNLYLHVGAVGAGGLHPLDSLVMFSDTRAADRISAQPAPHLSLALDGPGAARLRRDPANLVMAAATALREACERGGLGARLTLHKVLPVAGGVGGGSSDAAATLHILNDMWGIAFGEAALEDLAARLGSDVPACVRRRPLIMRGAGERLSEAVAPDLPCILVNPGVALETRRVFERFDQLAGHTALRESDPPAAGDVATFAQALAGYRNDLEPAAIALCPEIGRALSLIREQPGCLLARMSGSGATCYGLFADPASAAAAAAQIMRRKRKYWVRATLLRGAGPTR